MCGRALLVVLTWALALSASHRVGATSPGPKPAPPIYLDASGLFLADNKRGAVMLYRMADGTTVHAFPMAGFDRFAVTPDETVLIVAAHNCSITAWDISSGNELWRRAPDPSNLFASVTDISVRADGKAFVVSYNYHLGAVVFETTTGRKLDAIPFNSQRMDLMSATLSPDGTGGALVDLAGRLHTFDLDSGTLTDTGLRGAGPVRFSVDGKYIACTTYIGQDAFLQVVRAPAPVGAGPSAVEAPRTTTAAPFVFIARIEPTSDGGFLATGPALAGKTGATGLAATDQVVAGGRYSSATGQMRFVWQLPQTAEIGWDTDWRDPQSAIESPQSALLGVSNAFSEGTRVIDLRTGVTRLTVNDPTPRATTPPPTIRTPNPWILLLGIVTLGMLAAFLAWRVRRQAVAGHFPKS